jgi:hypothetical protein
LKWNFDEFADMHIEKFGCRLFFQSAEEAKYNWHTIDNWEFQSIVLGPKKQRK